MLKQRIITALILAPLALSGVFLLEQALFSYFVAAILVLAAWEWANLSGREQQGYRVAYALMMGGIILLALPALPVETVLTLSVFWWVLATIFVVTYPLSVNVWKSSVAKLIIGLLVIMPMWTGLVSLRSAELVVLPELNPLWLIFYVLMVVWAADTGAYFAGRAFGKSKLAPKVSPGKSWAGAWGGAAATSVLALVCGTFAGLDSATMLQLVLVTFVVTAVSIIGDLTESMFKRQRGIKDSSNLLPGHGGILDRIDSLVAAIPVFTFLLFSLGWIA